ncbi:unnamed protein product [Tilletia controversa]|uniref:Uncharacterized protein n=3 Tax=Tilletia TaxID=13289 RepID=A0A8X7MP73_9BASI|nr:hypothetical protein CF336_g5956 [Tilletia laevis]KAE8191909.1 hypothetical protein CF328_g5539 [Tilletia controversa]KAE8256649.1 hypothetical protein A4X03_0g5193 [Tilletia caries]KAE8194862.1 hypothetical protein CF335_g5235 [Tilletia laevis]KAE8243221.1 hypothetical protein A4X06_0g6467 [Tilletia controversa]
MRLTAFFVALALASGVLAGAGPQSGSLVINKATQPGSASVDAISTNSRMEKRLVKSSAPDSTNAGVKATHETPQRVPSDSFKPAAAHPQTEAAPKANLKANKPDEHKGTKKAKDVKKKSSKHIKASSSSSKKEGDSKDKREASPGKPGRPNGRPAGNRPAKDFASNSNAAWRRGPNDAHHKNAGHHKTRPVSAAPHGPAKPPARDFADQRNTAW